MLVIVGADGSKIVVSGYARSSAKAGAKRYAVGRRVAVALPPKVDLRGAMTPVEQQRRTNSCAANAVAGAYEYLMKRHRGDDAYDVSRLFIYYNARTLEGERDVKDVGSTIARAIDGLERFGACSEKTWPFRRAAVNGRPLKTAYSEAKRFLVEHVAVVPTSLTAWRHCLAQGNPIIFGLRLFPSFCSHRKSGLVPLPTPTERRLKRSFGHAMLCVGYDDRQRVFIVRNSWGRKWGDEGHCYVPYDYVMSRSLNIGDSWIIRCVVPVGIDPATWAGEAPVVRDFDHELATMSDDDYRLMLDAMGDVALELRVAHLVLRVAGADREVSRGELGHIALYMERVLTQLGVKLSAAAVLRNALRRLRDRDLFDESVTLFGAHLSKGFLTAMMGALRDVVAEDRASDEENTLLSRVAEAWQIERASPRATSAAHRPGRVRP